MKEFGKKKRKNVPRDGYLEDSTKGSSHMNPVNYKGDVLVQVWMDSRVIATLSNWIESKGLRPRFMSEVIRDPLMMLVDLITENGEVELVDNTAIARDLLQAKYRINLNRGGRGKKNALHNSILTGRREQFGARLTSSKTKDIYTPATKTKSYITDEEWEHYGKMNAEAKEQEMKEGIANAVASGKASEYVMKEVEVDKVIEAEPKVESKPEYVSVTKDEVVMKEGELDELSEEEFVEKQRKKDEARIAAENAPVDISQMKLAKE